MRNWFKNPGIYTSILYIIASGYFGKQLFQLQLLKNRDMAIVMLGVVIIGAILFLMTLSKNRRRIARIFGNGFAIAFSILFLIGGFGLSIANSLISDITVQNVEHKDISLIVLKEMVANMDGLEMSTEEVGLETNSLGKIRITNISEKDIPCVRIFYKFYLDDIPLSVGGITYTAKLTDVKAGEARVISPSHFSNGLSRIMMVRTYDTIE